MLLLRLLHCVRFLLCSLLFKAVKRALGKTGRGTGDKWVNRETGTGRSRDFYLEMPGTDLFSREFAQFRGFNASIAIGSHTKAYLCHCCLSFGRS